MILEIIINALRVRCPSFAGTPPVAPNVAGAVQFKQLEEATNIPLPFAFVVPLDDNPQESKAHNAVRQSMIDSFAVIVAISNTVDEKGQGSVVSVHTLRAEIWKALLGWQPSADYNGIEYQGGSLLKVDRARLWYQFEFGAYMEIGPTDGWEGDAQAALPHLDGITIRVDAISPQHDPNLAAAGVPDGRIENVVPVPKAGNLA